MTSGRGKTSNHGKGAGNSDDVDRKLCAATPKSVQPLQKVKNTARAENATSHTQTDNAIAFAAFKQS